MRGPGLARTGPASRPSSAGCSPGVQADPAIAGSLIIWISWWTRMLVLVVASHDDFDPGHPHETAVRWAQLIPGAELVSEEPGDPPLAPAGRKARERSTRSSRSTTLNP